jgi:hypothetical protein
MSVLTVTVSTMQLETKFLRLRTPVTIGSRFGDWEVTWAGGWTRFRLSYLVMVVRIIADDTKSESKARSVRIPSLAASRNDTW